LKQEVKNPLRYLKMMRERWSKSEEWAIRLVRSREERKEKRDQREESKELGTNESRSSYDF
jgi:hypothetical protein